MGMGGVAHGAQGKVFHHGRQGLHAGADHRGGHRKADGRHGHHASPEEEVYRGVQDDVHPESLRVRGVPA